MTAVQVRAELDKLRHEMQRRVDGEAEALAVIESITGPFDALNMPVAPVLMPVLYRAEKLRDIARRDMVGIQARIDQLQAELRGG